MKIFVRPAMIASLEGLYGKNATGEVSPSALTRRGQCTLWLSCPRSGCSGLLVFGISPTGEITWTARIHVDGEQVSARAGELSRPDAAAEIFAIAREFVRGFVKAAGL